MLYCDMDKKLADTMLKICCITWLRSYPMLIIEIEFFKEVVHTFGVVNKNVLHKLIIQACKLVKYETNRFK